MIRVPLSNGGETIIDDEDRVIVDGRTWARDTSGYVMAWFWDYDNKRKYRAALHRLITKAPRGMLVDHRNHDILDNRRANLRICTKTQNLANQRNKRGGSSRYKGVGWRKDNECWAAYITKHRKRKHLGYFTSEDDAARAYDAAAREMFGEFALTNFPLEITLEAA